MSVARRPEKRFPDGAPADRVEPHVMSAPPRRRAKFTVPPLAIDRRAPRSPSQGALSAGVLQARQSIQRGDGPPPIPGLFAQDHGDDGRGIDDNVHRLSDQLYN